MIVSYDAMRVLRHFLVHGTPVCGAELMKALKIGSGTVYPMLARLKAEAWIRHVGTLGGINTPPAHFYGLTPQGRAAFLDRLSRLTIPDNLWHEDGAEVAPRPRERHA